MSQTAEIECPRCQTLQDFRGWPSVNVTLNPELKKSILDSSLWLFTCSECRHECRIHYNLLYHDMEKKIMIRLRVEEYDDSAIADEMSENILQEINRNNPYQLRLVFSHRELQEKIQVLDTQGSDFKVELLKLFVSMSNGIDLEEEMYFDRFDKKFLGKKQVCFEMPNRSFQPLRCFPVPGRVKSIELLIEELRRMPTQWLNVNRRFMLEQLVQSGLASPVG